MGRFGLALRHAVRAVLACGVITAFSGAAYASKHSLVEQHWLEQSLLFDV